MAKIDLKDHISSPIESDEYLDQVNLEDLTDFFYETEALNVFGTKGKKAARAMASFFLANEYLNLCVSQTLNNTGIFITHDEQEEGTIH